MNGHEERGGDGRGTVEGKQLSFFSLDTHHTDDVTFPLLSPTDGVMHSSDFTMVVLDETFW